LKKSQIRKEGSPRCAVDLIHRKEDETVYVSNTTRSVNRLTAKAKAHYLGGAKGEERHSEAQKGRGMIAEGNSA